MVLEICVDSVASAIAAERGGAQRVELCSDLLEGGITPSPGLLQAVRDALHIDLVVMIRPRGGDFVYEADEFAVMQADIRHARRLGADGVVLGVLTLDNRIDIDRTRQMVELAAPLPVTFHRAADLVPDQVTAMDDIVSAGVSRVLTSGGAERAAEGLSGIARLVQHARGRIQVVVGGRITPENIRVLARGTGAQEFHAALRTRVPSPVVRQDGAPVFGPDPEQESSRYVVREQDVRDLRRELDRVAAERVAALQ